MLKLHEFQLNTDPVTFHMLYSRDGELPRQRLLLTVIHKTPKNGDKLNIFSMQPCKILYCHLHSPESICYNYVKARGPLVGQI